MEENENMEDGKPISGYEFFFGVTIPAVAERFGGEVLEYRMLPRDKMIAAVLVSDRKGHRSWVIPDRKGDLRASLDALVEMYGLKGRVVRMPLDATPTDVLRGVRGLMDYYPAMEPDEHGTWKRGPLWLLGS